MKDKIREMLAFEDLSQDEKEKRHILGRLYGPVADVINPTRNGRKYSEELWENVFNNPIMKEKFNNKVMYGELGHPADRTEIDMEKIAVSMPEPPKKDKDGRLIAYLDILDTPNGRILKTLCDYGSTLGISSRGTGDLYTDDDGEEAVDPESYECECFDIVLVPAVESARLQFTEGLHPGKTMKQALCESLEKASDEDRKVMEEALHNLNIDVETPKQDSNPEVDENKQSDSTVTGIEESTEAVDNGSEELIKNLQEALSKNSELESQVKELKEQAAVNDVMVSKLKEEIETGKSTIIRLTNIARKTRATNEDLTKSVSTLKEELNEKSQTIDNLLKEKEAVNVEDEESKKQLTESMNSMKVEHDKEVTAIKESYEEKLNNSNKLVEEFKAKAEKANKIKEGYKNLANNAVNKYIELRAKNIGSTPDEIKSRLNESYTLEDIDKVCESIQTYELNISKLPFNVDRKVRIKVNESAKQQPNGEVDDDYVDDTLIGIAEIVTNR